MSQRVMSSFRRSFCWDFFFFSCVFYLVFPPCLVHSQLSSWRVLKALTSPPRCSPLTCLASLSCSEELALITDLCRMEIWRSGLRETTRLCLCCDSASLDDFVCAVCRGAARECFSRDAVLLLIFAASCFVLKQFAQSLMLCRLGVGFFFHVSCQRELRIDVRQQGGNFKV